MATARGHSMSRGTETTYGWSTSSVGTLDFVMPAAIFPFQMPDMYSGQKLVSPTGRKLCAKKVALKTTPNQSTTEMPCLWKQHEMATQTKSCIKDYINKEREKKILENQVYVKTIAEVMLLTELPHRTFPRGVTQSVRTQITEATFRLF